MWVTDGGEEEEVSPLGQYSLLPKDWGAREEEHGAEWGPGGPTPQPCHPLEDLQMLHPLPGPHSPHLENGAKSDIHGEAGGPFLPSGRCPSARSPPCPAVGPFSSVANAY